MKRSTYRSGFVLAAAFVFGAAALAALPAPLAAQGFVPGTGQHVPQVGDDFEDPSWGFRFNPPKSSKELNEQMFQPMASSTNGRWYEGPLRGYPDVLKRVDTPADGLPGSLGSLLIQSRDTGVYQKPSGQMQQDDLIVNVRGRLRGQVPAAWQPSCTVRVYMPPFDQWENRVGNTFAFRAGCFGSNSEKENEEYWPGLFVYFYSSHDKRYKEDSAAFLIRSDSRGHDIHGPKITETGWWTLGMSFTPDGRVHYYGHPGVADLTAADHIASHMPYSLRCEKFDTFFFNVCSPDNARTWSTPWIIDDPALYYNRPAATAARPGKSR